MSFNLSAMKLHLMFLSLLCLTACFRGEVDNPSFVVSSPSGTSSIVKLYNADEQVTYDLKLNTPRVGMTTSTTIYSSQDISWVGSDGVVFGWQDDRHLTIGWPDGFPPIHGQEHVGDIDISYRSYEPDIDHIANRNLHKLRLHNTTVSFRELDLQYDKARYAATNEPVPNTKCIVEIGGLDGDAFEGVTVQIIGNGIGRSGDKYPSPGMVGVNYIFSKAVGQYASMTPTQAKLGSIYPHVLDEVYEPEKSTVTPEQTTNSLYYKQYKSSEALTLFSELQQGKLAMKVGLNFGQEILYYEADVNLSKDVIDKFNACSAKTNIYSLPANIYGSLFQVPYSPRVITSESTLPLIKSDATPPFKIGESFDVFMTDIKMQGYTSAAIDTHSKSGANGEVTSVTLGYSGIRLFFASNDNHELETIRYDPPYSGKVHGIGLGDSLVSLNNMLGSPVKPPWEFAGKSAYVYAGTNGRYDRFDIGDGVVKTIFVIR